ncbi:MAG: tRNA pseudouridine(55) synthase TruB [Bradyrhizobium sp.]|nr:tRNA pseudouridine(55) synthase TruB [Bradyrhizobium sp.]
MIATPAKSVIDTQVHDVSKNNFADAVRHGSRSNSESPSNGEPRGNNDPRAQKQQRQSNNQPRRDKRDIHGWIVLDKPIGMTSTQAVAVVKRLFSARRAGHAGTLDPLASGGLPIALGEATKTVPFVMEGRKRYRFTVRWGEERDTDDTEGQVVKTSEARPTAEQIRALLPQFTGIIEQIPPRYSAIKVQGERAYDLARDGEVVELASRPVEIHQLELMEQTDNSQSVFEAECGKGTYVRALARDIGRILGCFGHICALRRTLVGPFGENDMILLEQLEALCNRAASGEGSLADALLPVETALDDIPALAVTRADAARLHRGQTVLLRGRDAPNSSGTVYVTVAGRLLALAEVNNGEVIPKRVFNLTGLTASSGRNERV